MGQHKGNMQSLKGGDTIVLPDGQIVHVGRTWLKKLPVPSD